MPKVLIIDDDYEQLALFSTAFANKGFAVAKAQSGEEGIAVASREKPNVILLDIVMPGMSGLEAAEKIKSLGSIKEIPLVLMTNLSRPGLATEAIKAGADLFIMKSDLTPSALVGKVRELLKN